MMNSGVVTQNFTCRMESNFSTNKTMARRLNNVERMVAVHLDFLYTHNSYPVSDINLFSRVYFSHPGTSFSTMNWIKISIL